jgi:hypothetical protein
MEREMKLLNSGKYDFLKLIKTDKPQELKGRYNMAVKAVDFFGNDTIKFIQVSV